MFEGREGESEQEYKLRQDSTARETAAGQMKEFLSSPDGMNHLIGDTCQFLLRALKDDTLSAAAGELLLQGVVLCWAALELAARDGFVAFLNMNPSFTARLLADPVAKRRFMLSKVSLDTLAAHGFDLSQKMGTVLSEQQDFSDVTSIKAVYEALFPEDGQLKSALDQADLRLVCERRHLVVHRRGVVDATYIKNTGCRQSPGERLKVTPEELETHIKTCVRAIGESLRAVGSVT